MFKRGNTIRYCDILTCASPNKRYGEKYYNITPEENFRALESRIEFIIKIASDYNINELILGAFGCGVFGQHPLEVAKLFKKYIYSTEWNNNTNIIFAIPKSVNGMNFDYFYQELNG
jgi:uncharacterized protein (TIGR02452 family)